MTILDLTFIKRFLVIYLLNLSQLANIFNINQTSNYPQIRSPRTYTFVDLIDLDIFITSF